jgi:hypothetical protein
MPPGKNRCGGSKRAAILFYSQRRRAGPAGAPRPGCPDPRTPGGGGGAAAVRYSWGSAAVAPQLIAAVCYRMPGSAEAGACAASWHGPMARPHGAVALAPQGWLRSAQAWAGWRALSSS